MGCNFDSTLYSGSGHIPSMNEVTYRDSGVQGHWDMQLKPTACERKQVVFWDKHLIYGMKKVERLDLGLTILPP